MQYKWLDQKEYPFAAKYFSTEGHRLHYIDEGSGETLLFVHGTPSWSFDFRHLVKALSKQYRCIAIDHIGFGLSDKPEHYNYSTLQHSKTLSYFIDYLQLKEITLIAHDFGGPIGMNSALEKPERFKRIIILNSWLWSSENEPAFIKIKKVLKSPLLPFLYRYLNFSPRYLLPSSFGAHKLPKALLKQYTSPFANKRERNGTVAFAHSLLNDQAWFESLWEQRSKLKHLPMLLIWGMKDLFVSPSYLAKWQNGFPHATTVQLNTCGHFPQEEEHEKTITAIQYWLSNNP